MDSCLDQILGSFRGANLYPLICPTPKVKFLNCSTKKVETHNVGSLDILFMDNCLDQI